MGKLETKSSKSSKDSLLKARKSHERDENAIEEINGNGITKKTKLENGHVKKENKKSIIQSVEEDIKNKKIVDSALAEANKLENYKINPKTIKLLNNLGITYLFPIQAATYDIIYSGKDLIGRDKTGSGKTYSYALPLTERYREEKILKNRGTHPPLILVVIPTRELAIQVTNTFKTLVQSEDEFRVLSVYGGTEVRQQVLDLRKGCEIAVGTPGRIIDMIERGNLRFNELRAVILDEADQMLDMGFQEDVEKIYDAIVKEAKRENLQSLLFSATVPDWVHQVSKKFLKENHGFVDLVKGKDIKTPTTVRHLKINCPYYSRLGAIADIITYYGGQHCRTIIFCETKQEANEIMLSAKLKQDAQVLHGDIPQKQREVTFKAFREGKVKILVATNVAARGLDIPEVDLIVQLEPPKDVDTYIHRAGRTARAGRSGVCVTFFTKKQISLIERIENRAKVRFELIGAPQPVDIIRANARDIVLSMKNVSKDVLPLFKDIAEELVEELGTADALSRALALICGCNEKVKQRSLLCAIEGYITYIVETQNEFYSVSYVWGFLKRYFDHEITESIKGMRSFKNHKGAAFDVPEQHGELFDKFIEENPELKGYIIKKAESLPEFEEEGGNNKSSNGSGFTNYRSYNNENMRNDRATNDKRANSSVLRARDERKVFVGGLSFDTKEEDLMRFFKDEQFTPEDVIILKDDNGRSKGVGFVLFDAKEIAEKAIRLSGRRLNSRSLRINMASEKPK